MARLFAVLFALVAAVLAVPATVSTYPESWDVDTIPMIGTMDYRPLPGGYGYGSSSMASWITSQMAKEKAKTGMISFPPAWGAPPTMHTRDMVTLPFGYGSGSSTLRAWITEKASTVNGETVAEFDGFLKGR